MSNAIKKITNQFIKQHSISVVNYSTLKDVAKRIGYTIIEFNNIFNDKDVETVIQNLRLSEAVSQSRGFTYVSKDYRLIFINEDLSDDEKTLVLSHELGHIVCEHFTTTPIIGKDVKEEYEANEFSHYLLNQNSLRNLKLTITKHKKKVAVVALSFVAILVTIVTVITINQEQSYYDNCYITSTGNKYHKKDCIFVKDKTTVKRLTKEEYDAGKYEACDMCLPDKE